VQIYIVETLTNVQHSSPCCLVDPLRAIVLRDVCLVYVPDGADALLSLLKAKFAETAREDDAPFEFR
jgi:hypothetical protein